MRSNLVKVADQVQMTAWALLSGDSNPLHIDPAYAASTRYGGTIAHGHMVVAWLTEWLASGGSPARLSGITLEALRFRAPVRPGHRYEVRSIGGGVQIADDEGNVVLTANIREPAAENELG